MKLVFLCGGIGKRMHPITEDKVLLKFLGKTLLEHQIELAMKVGINDFVIIYNRFNKERIENICKRLKGNFRFAIQGEPKGMADAMIGAEDILDGEVIVAILNDVFEASAYEKILEEKKSGCDAALLGYKVDSYFPGGYFKLDKKGNFVEIMEKPGEGNEPSDLVNIVVHYHKDVKKFIEYLKKVTSDRDDVYEKALGIMAKDGLKIKVVVYSDYWGAIKYPWHILEITKYFLDKAEGRISPTARISEKATIEGKVIIEDNVRIFEGASIKGPCYIGRNTVIGTNSLVWNYSHIGEYSVVGYKSEVKNSWVGNNCWFHSNYIGDSVISNSCMFGAGSITANFRFDEKTVKVKIGENLIDTGTNKFGVMMGENSKTGINSCLMPGVKVGPNSVVGPGVVLTQNVDADKVITLKQEHLSESNVFGYGNKKEELMRKLLQKK